MKGFFLITLTLAGSWLVTLYAQRLTLSSDNPNYYLKVNQVFTNSVTVNDPLTHINYFQPGDKILLIQMAGTTLPSTGDFLTKSSKTIVSWQNTGKFEVLQLDDVVGNVVYFTDDISNIYDNGEKIQLVRLAEGETVVVDGTIHGTPWNGEVGGIVGILGIDSVILNNGSVLDINAGGFRGGAVPSEYYNGSCRYGISDTEADTLHFTDSFTGRSGNKGEGIINALWPYTKGTAFNVNGGGAGNGLFAGGGGGSNFTVGGDGGRQSYLCTSNYSAKGGWGGYDCSDLYANPLKPKIIMGGGGGSGTRTNATAPSRGGNGGGIIIIITSYLKVGNTSSLKANGEHSSPALPLKSAYSGGGGGAGGTVLLDIDTLLGASLNIQIKGGNGCSSSETGAGAGGSGSGGVFWHSGNSMGNIFLDSVSGNPGLTSGGSGYAAQNGFSGFAGVRLKNLIVPLTGFLFNSIKGVDTICSGQVPAALTASQPKGGNGIYTYKWEKSTDLVNWLPAVGNQQLREFISVPLTQTTSFRRIVNSVNAITGSEIHDTSRIVEVFVYNVISNNTITGTDTVCFNDDGKVLSGIDGLSGGNNNFVFGWMKRSDGQNWIPCGDQPAFDPAKLTLTTSYLRIVNSTAYCSDTSNIATITVLPAVTMNTFNSPDTSICENSSPGRLQIPDPQGGDNTFYYLWQRKSVPGSWISIPLTSDSIRYTEGVLADTMLYRRIVYSGNDDACIDTSNIKSVIIMPLIANNRILGSEIQYTCYNSPAELAGSNPEKGFGEYAYQWEKSTDNLNWQSTGFTAKNLWSDNLKETTFFRRTVYSGIAHHECSDVSSAVEVKLNPLPYGNVFDRSDSLCSGETLFVKFNVSGNGPFNVTVKGEDLIQSSKDNIIGPIDSVRFNPLTTQQYIIENITDDSSCFADKNTLLWINPAIVYQIPKADAGADNAVCSDKYTLQAVKTNEGYRGQWFSDYASFDDASKSNALTTVDFFDKHQFIWKESNWRCSDMDTVDITFYEQPDIPEAGEDQTLDFIFTTKLQASSATAGSGEWSVITGKADIDEISNPETTISELSMNTGLKWTVKNGNCLTVADSLKIIINPLKIMKGFAADGENNFFDFSAENAERIWVKIYNSAGLLIFESDDYNRNEKERWYGYNMNGEELPEGTYYYIADIKVIGKTDKVQFRSFVEILRK